jgi:outer membrane receptor protein involved in Fe transport
VTDATGAVIPGVTVTVTNVGTGETRSFVTDQFGNYVVNNVQPGQYRVEAQLAGFKTAQRSDVAVAVGRTVRVDFTLDVGEAREVVSVVGEAPLLSTEKSGLGQVIDRQKMTTLPLTGGAGRSFFDLVALSAGVSQQQGEGFALGNMRISGGRPRADDYLLDGTSIQQIVFGGPAVNPSVDSIEEFKVETNSYPAEYGRISGGIVNAVTRSGTNRFHGTVYEFLRNDKLDARNFFLPATSEKDPLRQNEYGFAVGGPIKKDKAFFFGDYQGFRRRRGLVFVNTQVPTVTMKQGDFSDFLGAEISTDACGRPVLQGAIYDPATERVAAVGDPTCPGGSGGQTVRDPFAGNVIPAGMFSPASESFLPLWPDPNSGGTNFTRTAADRLDIHRFNVRLDHNVSEKNKWFFVFHFENSDSFPAQPLPDERAAGFPSGLSTIVPARTGTLAWNHTFGPTMINEFRFGFTRRNPARVPGGYGTVAPADFNVPGFPECTLPGSNGKCGTPIISVLGFHTISGGSMLFEPAEIYQFADSVSKVMGRHNIKFGTDIRRFRINNIQPNSANGSFSFNPAQTALPGVAGTGHAFASFLLGRVNNGGADIQEDFLRTRTSSYAFYVQDDFKVTPRFTVNIGVRYQMDLAWKEKFNRAANFNIDTLEWELLGINAPRTAFDNDFNNFGPRFGFAFNPFPSFVVRGAYGMLYPGNTTRGRGGDMNPSPLLLVRTSFTPADNVILHDLPPINTTVDDPDTVLESAKSFSVYSDRTQRQQYVQQWNLTLEKQFAGDILVSGSYAGSKGTRLLGNFFYNIFQRSEEQVIATGWGGFGEDGPLGAAGNGAIGWVFPNFDGIANSSYHSGQARFEKRFSGGLSFLGSYTFSKLIDDASSDWSTFGGLDVQGQDYLNRKADRSVSAGDIRHRLVVSYIYELPFGPGKSRLSSGPAGYLIGGWQLSGITTIQSGFPFGVVDGCFGFCNAARAWATRPDKIGNPQVPEGQRGPENWVDFSAYDFSNSFNFDTTRPFGNAPRFDDHVRGPGLANFDFALLKNIPISPLGERGRLEFRTEFFNLFNTPHFGNPRAGSFDARFGTITSTRLPNRQIQFGLKLHF